jgi:hypothetical protein
MVSFVNIINKLLSCSDKSYKQIRPNGQFFFYLHRYPSIICSASVKKMFLALIQVWNRIQSCLSTTTKSSALDSLIPIMLSMLGSQIGLAYGKDLV